MAVRQTGKRRNTKDGRSFIEIIFVLALLVAAFIYFVPQYLGVSVDKLHPAGPSGPVSDAKDVSCRANINVIRQSIAAKRVAGTNPRSISDAGFAGEAKCPAGGEDYIYLPDSGKVSCPHPGHESY